MCPLRSPGSCSALLSPADGARRVRRAKMARSGARWPRLLLPALLALALPAAAERSPGPAGERGAGLGMRVRGSGCGCGAGVGMRWPCPREVCAGGGDALLAGRHRPLCACRLGDIRREGRAGLGPAASPRYLFMFPRPVPAPHGNAERLSAGGRGRRGSDT